MWRMNRNESNRLENCFDTCRTSTTQKDHPEWKKKGGERKYSSAPNFFSIIEVTIVEKHPVRVISRSLLFHIEKRQLGWRLFCPCREKSVWLFERLNLNNSTQRRSLINLSSLGAYICQRSQSTFGYCSRRKLEYSSSSEWGSEGMHQSIFSSQRALLSSACYLHC